MISQKNAVYSAFCDAVANIDGVSSISDLSESQLKTVREQVKESVAAGLASGEVEHDNRTLMSDPKEALRYAGALCSNWFKRDERISGGAKYAPATARGPQVRDELLKKLTTARKSAAVHNPALLAVIDERIAARRSELSAAKSKSKVIPLGEALESLKALGIEV
jgi:hypothetical protein